MTAVQTTESRDIARPLKVLVPLIKKDFEDADRAGRPYQEAAGEKLHEAQKGHFQGNTAGFFKWAEDTFGKTRLTIRTSMAWSALGGAKSFKTQREVRLMPKSQGGLGHIKPLAREWTAPVDDIVDRARREAVRLVQDEALSRAEERDAERALANRLIDIGYKVLAKELHPDKVGGSRDAMKRLNSVRDKLKHSI